MTRVSMFTVAGKIDGDRSRYDAFDNPLFIVVRI